MTTTPTPRLVLHIGEAHDRYARCGLCNTPNLGTGPGTDSADGDIRMVAVATNHKPGEDCIRVCDTCADNHWPGARLAAAALDHFAGALLDAPTEAHRDFYYEAVRTQLDSVMHMIRDASPLTSAAFDTGIPKDEAAMPCACGGGEAHPCSGCGQPVHSHQDDEFGHVYLCLNDECPND
jgi:hypothetical protein